MQLERVRIQNYKCLKDVDVTFRSPAGERDFFAHFLVGVNGSGKSCFLEALGLIFTCVMQGEPPGFPFALEYRVRRGEARVTVRPARRDGGKLRVSVTAGGKTQKLDRVPDEYLPRRIVAFSSGANHMMESALLSAPRASLVRDLYDLAGPWGGKAEAVLRGAEREAEISRVLERYQALDTDPRVFSVDGAAARLVAPALFAVVPHFADRELAESYFRLRDRLLRRIGGKFRPAAFSVTVDEEMLERAVTDRRNSPQFGLLAKLFRHRQPDGGGPLHTWMVRRPILSPPDAPWYGREAEGGPRMAQTAVFALEPWEGEPERDWMWSPALSREFDGDPMVLLNVLMAARRGNILRDVQLAFRGEEGLLGLEALSDGELMWLARMGLALMSRLSGSAGTLFLFDEPDIHFNNEWNMDFVKLLRQCGETPAEALEHEFVIATHSTLLLTDAYPEQISLFSSAGGRGVRVEETPVSPFAAQQDELARRLFSASAVGSYAMDRVDSLMERARTPEELLELIEKTGPGYQRFRLYERYHELRRRQR